MIKNTLLEISENFKKLSENCTTDIKKASEAMINSLNKNHKIMFCGNGGSAADSQHLAAELVGRYRKDRRPLAALSLTTDTSIISAISNDFSFDQIFTRQINALGKEGDILYAISTSGKSKNIISAIKLAKELGITVIGITGCHANDMSDLCDILIKAPASRPDRIQEMHIAIGQLICEIIETSIC